MITEPLTFNGRAHKSPDLSRLIVRHGPGIVRQACAALDLPPSPENLGAIAAECWELEPKH
jgi:hypothetical protein